MEDGYKYYAFISYNHQDEKWAKRIHRKLLHYRLPSVARTELGKNVRINPVFRYVTNLSLGHLREQIAKELEASKYLVVVCSPHSARPNVLGEHWVNDEVNHFIKIGRKDRIVPVIVDGEPNVGGVRECFPPALRTAEIAAADFAHGTREDRKIAFLKLVAKLLGLMPETLIDYAAAEDQRLRRLRWLKRLPLLLLGVAVLAVGIDWCRPVRVDYADYVGEYGLPRGLFRLTEEEVAHRSMHYAFEYRGYEIKPTVHPQDVGGLLRPFGFSRILRRVVQAASSGIPRRSMHTEHADRPVAQEFVYDRGGSVVRVRECRQYELSEDCVSLRPNRILQFENTDDGAEATVNGLVKFMTPDRVGGAAVLSRTASEGTEGSRVEQYVVTRDAAGRVSRIDYCNASGYPVMNDDGVWGESFVRDDDFGRITEWWNLDRRGGRHANRKGVAGRKYSYVGRVMKRAEYVDASGMPVAGPYDWMVCIDSFDRWDNNVHSEYRDAQDRRMADKTGISGYYAAYDDAGNITNCYYVNQQDRIAPLSGGIAGSRSSYDAECRMTSCTYIGPDGRTCCGSDGIAGTLYGYEDGQRVCDTTVGPDGKPTVNANGVAFSRYTFNGRGNLLSVRYADTNGAPTLCSEGHAGYDCQVNGKGQTLRTTYVDTAGRPTMSSCGYSSLVHAYNRAGKIRVERYLDAEGKPTCEKSGIVEMRIEYDDFGRERLRSYFDAEGKATVNTDGYHSMETHYDAGGRAFGSVYRNAENVRTVSRFGYAELRNLYNDAGILVRQMYYDADGRPTMLAQGYAGYTNSVNAAGLVESVTYLNCEEKPTISSYGYAGVRTSYDSLGRIRSQMALDENGKPTVGRGGAVTVESRYDKAGKEVYKGYFDAHRRLVVDKEMNCAEWECMYDHYGRLTNCVYRDEERRLIVSSAGYAAKTYEYDGYGRCTCERHFGPDGKPMLTSKRISEIRHAYDAFGREIRTEYLGMDGKPVPHKDSNACGVAREYDAQGRNTLSVCLDADGRPACVKYDVAGVRMAYDAAGHVMRQTYVDAAGNVALHEVGNAHLVFEYDRFGHRTRCIALGMRGERVNTREGMCEAVDTYDARGNLVSELYLDAKGKYCRNKDDIYGLFRKYDGVGRLVGIVTADKNGKPLEVDGEGVRTENKRDGYGRVTYIVRTNAAGQPVPDNDGITKAYIEYHEGTANIKKADIYGECDDKPLKDLAGVYRVVRELDPVGNETSCTCYDRNGHQLSLKKIAVVQSMGGADSAAVGINEGDIVCSLGEYGLEDDGDVGLLDRQMRKLSGETKPVVVARKAGAGDTYDIVDAELPPGMFGMKFRQMMTLESYYDRIVAELKSHGDVQAAGAKAPGGMEDGNE